MIEIVFSDSACGGLKMALRYGKGEFDCIGIGVSVLNADGSKPTEAEIEDARRQALEKERLAWENAVPIDGNPEDIFGFGLALSIGDISEDRPGARRRQVMEWLYSIYPENVGRQAAQEQLQMANGNLDTVLGRAAEGEELRVWYSDQPDELCGLYWIMAMLNPLEGRLGRISLVKLPEWDAGIDDSVVHWACWGEMAPGEWYKYLAAQKTAPPAFCKHSAARWRALQKENAPLRATLNGQLVSAPETLYDDFIMREISAEKESFNEAMIIGRVLGKQRLAISDAWIALRIEEMMTAGKLEAISTAPEDSPVYHRLLRKLRP
jgi:hypothetical protein